MSRLPVLFLLVVAVVYGVARISENVNDDKYAVGKITVIVPSHVDMMRKAQKANFYAEDGNHLKLPEGTELRMLKRLETSGPHQPFITPDKMRVEVAAGAFQGKIGWVSRDDMEAKPKK